jgi:hypothetical protein
MLRPMRKTDKDDLALELQELINDLPKTASNGFHELATAIHQKKTHSSERRLEVGKHLMMLGNLAAGAMLFGQAFSGFPFNIQIAALGILTWAVFYAFAIYIMKGGESL